MWLCQVHRMMVCQVARLHTGQVARLQVARLHIGQVARLHIGQVARLQKRPGGIITNRVKAREQVPPFTPTTSMVSSRLTVGHKLHTWLPSQLRILTPR